MSVNPNSVPRTPITDARNNMSPFRPVNQSQRDILNSADRTIQSDYSNTYNPSTGAGGSFADRSKALIDAGFNLRGTGNYGSNSLNQIMIKQQTPGSENSKLALDDSFVVADRIMSNLMMLAFKKGIKSSGEFKAKGEELLKEAAGKDYDELIKTGAFPNFITAGSQLYTNKLRNYTPAAAQVGIVDTQRPMTDTEQQVQTSANQSMQNPPKLRKPQ